MSSDFPAAIASELRAEMGRQNLTAKRLAFRIGKPNTTVGRWLNGTTPIALADLALLCAGLEVPISELTARAEARSPEPHLPHAEGAGLQADTPRYLSSPDGTPRHLHSVRTGTIGRRPSRRIGHTVGITGHGPTFRTQICAYLHPQIGRSVA